jgi:hypothetical protein
MTLIGIEIKRPSFWSLTQAVGVSVGVWLLLTLSQLGAKNAVDAGANLVTVVFGFVSNVIGIDVTRGGRHLALNVVSCIVVLVMYYALAALVLTFR